MKRRKFKNKKPFPKLPMPGKCCRITVYLGFLMIAALCGFHLLTRYFSHSVESALYGASCVLFLVSCYFFIKDINYVKRMLAAFVRILERKSRFIRLFLNDYRYRTFFITGLGLLINLAYALFNGGVGYLSGSAWYVTLAVYYAVLSLIRFRAMTYGKRFRQGKTDTASNQGTSPAKKTTITSVQKKELGLYRNTSILIIFLTVVLSGMVVLTMEAHGGKHYPGTLIYVAALYTFLKVPLAIKNWLAAKSERTPIIMTIRSISFTDACVSVLSLQTAMFDSFGDMAADFERMMNGITGAVICLASLGIGIYGVTSAKKIQF